MSQIIGLGFLTAAAILTFKGSSSSPSPKQELPKKKSRISGGPKSKNPITKIRKDPLAVLQSPYKSKFKLYGVYHFSGWTWFILAKVPKTTDIIQMALVTSPVVPDGELGSVYKNDLHDEWEVDLNWEKLLPSGWKKVE